MRVVLDVYRCVCWIPWWRRTSRPTYHDSERFFISLRDFFFKGDGWLSSYVNVLCVCMRTLLVESRSHPKIQSRNIHMSESFFSSSLVLPVDGLGGGLVCLAESPHSHTSPCILTWFWACALVPFCTFHQRRIFMSVVRISTRRAQEKKFHRMTEWSFF